MENKLKNIELYIKTSIMKDILGTVARDYETLPEEKKSEKEFLMKRLFRS